MIVPYPAGGPTDTIARLLGERMRASLGQPVIIENVAGAGGNIGVGRVARAAGDGYTLGIGQRSRPVDDVRAPMPDAQRITIASRAGDSGRHRCSAARAGHVFDDDRLPGQARMRSPRQALIVLGSPARRPDTARSS